MKPIELLFYFIALFVVIVFTIGSGLACVAFMLDGRYALGLVAGVVLVAFVGMLDRLLRGF
jgi:hypothetical protein